MIKFWGLKLKFCLKYEKNDKIDQKFFFEEN